MHTFTSMYSRYNGFMLGLFLELSKQSRLARSRIKMLARIEDFLADVEIDIEIPEVSTLSRSAQRGLQTRIGNALAKCDGELKAFFVAGSSTGQYISNPQSPPSSAFDLFESIEDNLNDNFTIAPDFIIAVDALPPNASIEQLIAPALLVIEKSIASVRYEFRSCFVAMPFRKPHYRIYREVISPALRAANLRPIRAWGIIRTEDYQDLLFNLIRKCGHTIADVSGGNANVLMELGYAMGRGRRTLPIVASGKPAISNIHRRDLTKYNAGKIRLAQRQIQKGVDRLVNR